jgi:hypothetical protein
MPDKFVEGIVYPCDQCGRPVRLVGHNRVESWTCEPCRKGETPGLLNEGIELEETAERYDPSRAVIPF